MSNEGNHFWETIKDSIEKISKDCDTKWRKRKRIIGTKFLILFIFKLVLSKNKQGYGSVLGEIWDDYSQKDLTPPQKSIPSASSLCEARQKLPEAVFKDLNTELILTFDKETEEGEWNGHRVFGVDGSRLNLPIELMENGYKPWNKKLHHNPHGLMSSLYRLSTGVVYDFVMTNKYSEREHALNHLQLMKPNDVVVFDRGYFSYLMLHQCIEKDIFVLFRIGKNFGNKKILEFINSDKTDEIIEYIPSLGSTYDFKKQGYNLDFRPLRLRLVKWTFKDTQYTGATTLLSHDYTIQSLSDLYHSRWGIEELYKVSKTMIDVEDFHSKTELGIKQELYAHFVLINIARFLELAVSKNNPKSPQKAYMKTAYGSVDVYKINFKNCLLITGRYLHDIIYTPYKKFIHYCLPKILKAIGRIKHKIRPNRRFARKSFKPYNKGIYNEVLAATP